MFKRDIYLEKYPQHFNKKSCDYIAYSKGIDQGFVILEFKDRSELYEFNDGPYMCLGTYKTLPEALKASDEFN